MPEPILLAGPLTPEQAVRARCTGCGFERDIDVPDALNQDAIWSCGRCGERKLTFKYHEGEACGNCQKLGWWNGGAGGTGDGYCSRACKLQAEYAASLGAGG